MLLPEMPACQIFTFRYKYCSAKYLFILLNNLFALFNLFDPLTNLTNLTNLTHLTTFLRL